MKYSYEDRLRAVAYVLRDRLSAGASAARLGCHRKDVQHRVSRYNRYGEEGLRMKQGSYSGDFKLSVITYMRENHLSLFETAVRFGIPRACTVNQWNRIYPQGGAPGLYRDNRGRKKMKPTKPKKPKEPLSADAQLRAEHELLRAENAYLKTLRALVEERIARERGKDAGPSKD